MVGRRSRLSAARATAVSQTATSDHWRTGMRLHGRTSFIAHAAVLAAAFLMSPTARAGEGPFFITYTHQMEEPGNLEFANKSVTGKPGDGSRFLGSAMEFEYGVKAWWTTEVYLDGQTTSRDSSLFTGYRWENRFRLLPREHWINPVLYVEFENINGADKSLLEVVNHDGADDLTASNSVARVERKREIEAKLILSSYYRGWTIAEKLHGREEPGSCAV
jgi:hypothetical protein